MRGRNQPPGAKRCQALWCLLSTRPHLEAGDTMTATLTALICIGLGLNARAGVERGTLGKPRLWAEPGSVIPRGKPVTLWCKWTLGTKECGLLKEGSQGPWRRQTSEELMNRARFSIPAMTEHHAGRYHCFYRTASGLLEHSDPLELEVTGSAPKPKLQAQPRSVIPWRSPVTLWCEGTLEAQQYHLYREDDPAFSDTRISPEPRNKAKFSIPAMTENQAGRYHCYYHSPAGWSQHSEPLDLVVTGIYSKPSLSFLPGPVVTSGGNVTLHCGSQQRLDGFILTEEGGDQLSWTLKPQQGLSGLTQNLLLVAPMQRWTFRCYGYYSDKLQVWSEPSDPLELLVLGPTASSGEGVTLQCHSQSPRDTFLLSKEEAAHPTLHLRQESQAQQFQSEFSLGAGSSALMGTYRCHGSPDLLSQPSGPLEYTVSGGPEDQPRMPESGPQDGDIPGLQGPSEVLTWVSVPCSVLPPALLLLVLLWCRRRITKSGATVKSENEVELDTRAAARGAPEDVTYAELGGWVLRQEMAAPPSSQDHVLPAEPCAYAALACTRPGPVPKDTE